jgi:staphylococcal nuclease domain-containing protein 1
VSNKSEYHEEAIQRFRALCEGRKLVAVIDYKEGPLMHLRLIDPSDPASSNDPIASINADLVREGFATVDKKGTPGRYLQNHPSILTRLADNLRLAKRERLGQFELGDVEEDDD